MNSDVTNHEEIESKDLEKNEELYESIYIMAQAMTFSRSNLLCITNRTKAKDINRHTYFLLIIILHHKVRAIKHSFDIFFIGLLEIYLIKRFYC